MNLYTLIHNFTNQNSIDTLEVLIIILLYFINI